MPTRGSDGRRERARQVAETLLTARRGAQAGSSGDAFGAVIDLLERADGALRIEQAKGRAVATRAHGAWATDDGDATADDLDAELRATLAGIHGMLLEHPVAGRSLFEALCAEGRAFADSPEGGELRDRLARSRSLRRAGLIWRTVTAGLLEPAPPEDPGRRLPSSYLDNVLRALDRTDLERVLGSLVAPGDRPT